jgi:hypothetical protein
MKSTYAENHIATARNRRDILVPHSIVIIFFKSGIGNRRLSKVFGFF